MNEDSPIFDSEDVDKDLESERPAHRRGIAVSTTLSRLIDVFHDVFDDDRIEVTRQTTAADVEAWDSLMHVSLVLAAEREFNIRFSSSEVAKLADIGELADLVDGKSGDGD